MSSDQIADDGKRRWNGVVDDFRQLNSSMNIHTVSPYHDFWWGEVFQRKKRTFAFKKIWNLIYPVKCECQKLEEIKPRGKYFSFLSQISGKLCNPMQNTRHNTYTWMKTDFFSLELSLIIVPHPRHYRSRTLFNDPSDCHVKMT